MNYLQQSSLKQQDQSLIMQKQYQYLTKCGMKWIVLEINEKFNL